MAYTSDGWQSRRVLHASALIDRAMAPAWAQQMVQQGGNPVAVSYDINNFVLQGRAFQDPVQRTTPNGFTVTELLVASNRKKPAYKDRAEEMILDVVPVKFIGKQGEVVAQHVRTGDGLIIQARIESQERPAKDGRIFRNTEVVAKEVSFYTSTNKPEGRDQRYGDRYEGSPNDRGPNNQRNIGREGWNGGGGGQTAMGDDDSIPFAPSYI